MHDGHNAMALARWPSASGAKNYERSMFFLVQHYRKRCSIVFGDNKGQEAKVRNEIYIMKHCQHYTLFDKLCNKTMNVLCFSLFNSIENGVR